MSGSFVSDLRRVGATLPAIIDDSNVNEIDKLSKLNFNDIYMAEDGRAFMRGLETKFKNRTPPLTGIPLGVKSEMSLLQKRVFKKGENSDSFFEDFEGMRFRVTKMPAITGTWYTLRRSLWPIPRFPILKGIPPIVPKTLGRLGRPSEGTGLILFCGETGSGKTTTACSLLQEYLLSYGDIASTIEDPVELLMEGPYGPNAHGFCFQHEVVQNNFEQAMKRALRETPRYIFFGEIRGRQEAKEALMASINGHVVISTIHAGNVKQGLDRLVSLASDNGSVELARQELSMGIKAVIHQRLLMNEDSPGKRLDMECLFIHDDDTRIRHLIAQGETRQLSYDLERQAIKINRDESPIDYDFSKTSR